MTDQTPQGSGRPPGPPPSSGWGAPQPPSRGPNGPNYVDGPIRVRPPDPFDLDRDGDGVGCET